MTKSVQDFYKYSRKTLSLLVAMIMFFLAFSCQKSPTISSFQNEEDDRLIADFIATHALSPSGEIVAGGQTGSIPLSDTVTRVGEIHIVHLKQGTGVTPSTKDRVDVTYRGYFLHNLNLFEEKREREKVWLSGAIEGIQKALTAMKTPSDSDNAASKAWIIIPSRLGWGADEMTSPVVPANTSLLYYMELHSISTIDNK